MKKLLLITILSLAFLLKPSMTFAQPMIGGSTKATSDDHTAREEAEGKEIWDKLQAKEITCESLSDADFGALGEYFMGQSIGNTERHAAMNQMMKNMMGEKGEEQIHITLGKRSSGCNTNASFPSGYGFMPMMGYGSWSGFGLGWIFMIIFWVLIILGVVALVRYLGGTKQNSTDKDKTPLDILKERYAKGEIDKKEFEEKKKDLG